MWKGHDPGVKWLAAQAAAETEAAAAAEIGAKAAETGAEETEAGGIVGWARASHGASWALCRVLKMHARVYGAV